jgi:hypothetical protein
MPWFRKHHTCPCGTDWWDEWDCLCNDRCPTCDAEIEPDEHEAILGGKSAKIRTLNDRFAAFLCADLRNTDNSRADHAQLLPSWLSVSKADKRLIFTAASKASEAAAFRASTERVSGPVFGSAGKQQRDWSSRHDGRLRSESGKVPGGARGATKGLELTGASATQGPRRGRSPRSLAGAALGPNPSCIVRSRQAWHAR